MRLQDRPSMERRALANLRHGARNMLGPSADDKRTSPRLWHKLGRVDLDRADDIADKGEGFDD